MRPWSRNRLSGSAALLSALLLPAPALAAPHLVRTIPNRSTLVTRELRTRRLVCLQAWVKAGSRDELNIPIVALVDINCNPQGVDYVIPSNDDAIRAIKLLVAKIADAVLEGKAMRKEEETLEEKSVAEAQARSEKPSRRAPKVVETEEELGDEALLGEATLAKMSANAAAPAEEAGKPKSRAPKDKEVVPDEAEKPVE